MNHEICCICTKPALKREGSVFEMCNECNQRYEDVQVTRHLPDHDPVNHPSHYTTHPSGVECIDVAEHFGFCVGNCIKYLWRAGLKEGADELQDLKKAQWYLNREIERREKK